LKEQQQQQQMAGDPMGKETVERATTTTTNGRGSNGNRKLNDCSLENYLRTFVPGVRKRYF